MHRHQSPVNSTGDGKQGTNEIERGPQALLTASFSSIGNILYTYGISDALLELSVGAGRGKDSVRFLV